MKKRESVIYCGVEDSDGNPVKLTEEQKKRFLKNMGKNAIFCEDNSIPKAMKVIAALKSK